MGMVFGVMNVEEPAYTVLLDRSSNRPTTPYEIRKYGERFGVETDYDGADDQPFSRLAKYIGVFGEPQNEGNKAISMTAPVSIQESGGGNGEAISMTAPVVISSESKTMQFMLPASYDSLNKVPKPLDPKVHVVDIPPAVGAVHRFSGARTDKATRRMAEALAKQLQSDGLDIDVQGTLATYEYWGYNPPFTIPVFRRNEVWIKLTDQQAEQLVNAYGPAKAEN